MDRLLQQATTINIKGESYRLKEQRKAGMLPIASPEKAPPQEKETADASG